METALSNKEIILLAEKYIRPPTPQMISPFFIVASPRSGTTLLERLLNRHSNIFIPPETAFFYQLEREGILGKAFHKQHAKEFCEKYITSRPARLLGLSKDPDIQEILLRKATSHGDVFLNLLHYLHGSPRKTHFGEKTPHHLHCINGILETFTEARVVVLIRDGRAVVNSRMRQPNWEKNIIGASKIWSRDAHRYKSLLSSPYSDQVISVRYEQLILNPEESLRKICSFLGENYEPEMLDETNTDTTRFTKYYTQNWMQKSTTGIDPARILAWQHELSPEKLALIENEAGEFLEELGYSLQTECVNKMNIVWLKEWVHHLAFRGQRRLKRLLKYPD